MNPMDLSNDNDTLFINEFYKNLRILSQDLYRHKKADANVNVRRDVQRKQLSSRRLSGLGGSLGLSDNEKDNTLQQYFTADSMNARVKQYAAVGGIPAEFVDKYTKEHLHMSSES